MKLAKKTLLTLLIIGSCALPEEAAGQRLYDAKRDEEAQAALKIVADLQAGTLFDKQLKNLSLLAKRDIEATLLSARSGMRADINKFITWTDVNCVVFGVKEKLAIPDALEPNEVKQKLAELDPKMDAAAGALEKLEAEAECNKDPTKCPEQKPGTLSIFFDRASELKDIQEAVAFFKESSEEGATDVSEATDELKAVLGVLESLYKGYTERMKNYNALQGELLDLQIPLKKVALQALQVEAQHRKNILRIYARRGVEEANIRKTITEYEASNARLGYGYRKVGQEMCGVIQSPIFFQPDNIEMGVRDLVSKVRQREQILAAAELARDGPLQELSLPMEHLLAARGRLVDTMMLLHTATALASRGRNPRELADLRLAQEEHAYSIRHSGVMARAYQLTVSTGVRRLALYHKGGLKPSLIAKLIHDAATVAIPAAIATN
jgi:hypothetical protein